MAQKSKAASLTPDLLMSRSVPPQSAPRKQSTDLSLTPAPTASQPEPAKAVAPPPAKANVKGIEPAPAPDPERIPGDASGAKAGPGVASGPPPSSATAVAEIVPAEPHGGDGKAAVVDDASKAEAFSDYRIRIPVPLGPSEHLELTLAAARSGRSCQEIIVEALFRYLEDIAGPPDRPAAPGPEGRR